MTETSQKDLDHLRYIELGHYVLAGIVTLFSMIPLLHVFMGVMITTGAFDDGANEMPFPVGFGMLFIVIGAASIIFGLCWAALIVLAARSIKQRKRHTFCLVVAGVTCLMAPLGTVLGVFSIIVLVRDSVKELFQ